MAAGLVFLVVSRITPARRFVGDTTSGAIAEPPSRSTPWADLLLYRASRGGDIFNAGKRSPIFVALPLGDAFFECWALEVTIKEPRHRAKSSSVNFRRDGTCIEQPLVQVLI